MEDIEIKNLLENIKVEPSARCWESIAGQLASGAAATSAASSLAAGNTTAHTAILASTSAKIIVGVLATAAVTAGIIIGVNVSGSSDNASPAVQNRQNTENIVAAADSIAEEDTTTELTEPHSQNKNFEKTPPASAQPLNTAETIPPAGHSASNSAQNTACPPAVTPPNTATQTVPDQSTDGIPSSGNSRPADSPTPVTPNSRSHPEVHQYITTSAAEDPVLEDYGEIPDNQPIVLEIPNAFTPNGDGYNDFFVITGIENCEHTKLIVRNRNGNVVFQSNDYHNNWDASRLEAGTYYYQFYYTLHGIGETRTGILNIVR